MQKFENSIDLVFNKFPCEILVLLKLVFCLDVFN